MADHVACPVEELPCGHMRSIEVGKRRLVLFRDADGTVSALDDRCSHAEVKLSRGTFCDGVVTCPAHGAKFDIRTGKQLCMPAVTPVRAYSARIERDAIVVTLPE